MSGKQLQQLSEGQLSLTGELTFSTVPALIKSSHKLFSSETQAAGHNVDLSAVSRADSAGIALLLELQRQGGTQLSFSNPTDQIRQIIDFSGLNGVLNIS